MNRGHRNRGSFDIQIRRKDFIDGSEDRNGKTGPGIGGARSVRFDSGNESNAFARILKLTIDTEVVAAERAGSNNGNADIALSCYRYAPLPSTAFRQRV